MKTTLNFFEATFNYNKSVRARKISLNEAIVNSENALISKVEVFSVSKNRLLLFLGISILFSLVFLAKAFVLQLINGDTNFALSVQNRIRRLSVLPERGVIYDRNKNILVRNKPAFSIDLSTDICSVSDCMSIVQKVNTYVAVDTTRVKSELDAKKPYIVLAAGLDKDKILNLEANIAQMPGVSIVTSPQRDYLFGEALSHVVGYVGLGETLYPTIVGKMGVEQSYDSHISGVPGAKIVQVDSTGISSKKLTEEATIPGKDIVLSIDKDLQLKAYELLKKTVEEKKAYGGAVVAQDPRTGGILAIVSYPSFDANKLSSGISVQDLTKLNEDPRFPFFDRAVSGAFPPGSTFKLVTAAGGLQEGVITPNTTINDPGYIQIGTYIFRNWKLDGHGEVNLERALQVSNDTYFYTVGGGYGNVVGLGIDRLSKWAKKFGYGSLTGIDIHGEVKGNMPNGSGRAWYLGDTYITAIGQGDVLATPLQVNNVTSYFANGGFLYKPFVVKEIYGQPERQPYALEKNLISQENYNLVREGLNKAVESGGTAYPLFDFALRHNGLRLAGKTGTSEYFDSKGEAKTHAWFTVFGPYDEKDAKASTIALTVFVEGGGGGADDASPIAKELLDLWFK